MNDTRLTGTIPGFTRNTASVNGVRLHYFVGGNPRGTPLLLWHGFLGTSYSWHKVAPLLADAGYSVLVPDMRGYGDSDKPVGNEGYDGRALAEEFRLRGEVRECLQSAGVVGNPAIPPFIE